IVFVLTFRKGCPYAYQLMLYYDLSLPITQGYCYDRYKHVEKFSILHPSFICIIEYYYFLLATPRNSSRSTILHPLSTSIWTTVFTLLVSSISHLTGGLHNW